MTEQGQAHSTTPDPALDQELVEVEGSGVHLSVDDLHEVRLHVTAELGRCTLLVREVLELKQGSVLPLNRMAGEMVDICINNVPLARGEAVVIGDTLHVRITEIFGFNKKESGDYE